MKQGPWPKPPCKDQRGGWASGPSPRWMATPAQSPLLSPWSLHRPLKTSQPPCPALPCRWACGQQAEDPLQRWSLEGRVLLNRHQSQPSTHGCACGLAWLIVAFLLNRRKERGPPASLSRLLHCLTQAPAPPPSRRASRCPPLGNTWPPPPPRPSRVSFLPWGPVAGRDLPELLLPPPSSLCLLPLNMWGETFLSFPRSAQKKKWSGC